MRPNSKMSASCRKKSRLLGEEQAEPRQIDLPIVDFGRREIGVQRQRRIQRRRDLVEDVERRLRIGVIGARREVAALDGRQRRHDVEAQPLPQVRDPRELARDRRALRPVSRDPTHRLVVARDSAVEVEAPGVGVRIERDRLERDPRLGDPAVVALRCARLPDAVPLPLHLVGAPEQPFLANAMGVHLETVAAALVVERIEKNVELIVEPRVRAALPQHLGRHELRLVVLHVGGEIQRIVVVQHEKARDLRRRRVLDGQDLMNVLGGDDRRGGPGRLIEPPVDRDRRARAHGPEPFHATRPACSDWASSAGGHASSASAAADARRCCMSHGGGAAAGRSQNGFPSSHLLCVSRTSKPSLSRRANSSPYICGPNTTSCTIGSSSLMPPRSDV